jgi:hypothetical protein
MGRAAARLGPLYVTGLVRTLYPDAPSYSALTISTPSLSPSPRNQVLAAPVLRGREKWLCSL